MGIAAGIDPERTLGSGSPATPVYAYNFLVSNNIVTDTHEGTIHNLLDWFRSNGTHFYGGYTWQNVHEHWGFYGMTPAQAVMNGTTRVGESSPQHWTAGCHGTNSFIKSVLKVVNIPVQLLYICGHSVAYFPSIDRYMDHGDNPYNLNVSGQPSKDISGVLIDSATFTARFGSSPHGTSSGDSICSGIGQAATDF